MKLLLLGAGIRTPLLINGLVRRQETLRLDEVVLYDVDQQRLETMASFARFFAERQGGGFRVSYSADFREAARGADFVFSAIRVGQERHRIIDERVPLRYGVLGQETTGPGGFAFALRTIPVMLEYARELVEVSPDAWLINFTNPAGIITQALLDHTPVRAIGICDTPTSMRRSIAGFLGRSSDEVYTDYFGLNHLGWIRRVLVDGEDVMPRLLDEYEALGASSHEWSLFDPELVRSLGLLPNEYLYYYYYRDRAIAHIQESGQTRGEQILQINGPAWREMARYIANGEPEQVLRAYQRATATRGSTYMARESGREVEQPEDAETPSVFEGDGYEALAMEVMSAIVQKRKAALILNVRNGGCIQELEPSDVVEVVTLMDQNGPQPISQERMPRQVGPLVEAVKTYERLTIEAAVDGSYDAAVLALTVHPLVGSYPLAKRIVDDYLSQQRDQLPQFAA